MTIDVTGYTVGANEPLNYARILYAPVAGTVTAAGTGGALAQNDYTFQRWVPGAGAVAWTLELAAPGAVDCVFIAAHNLSGVEVTIATSPNLVDAFADVVILTPADNTTICALFNDAGSPVTAQRVRISLNDGTGVAVGVIRAGVALQMAAPFYNGHKPATLQRVTEARQQFSESGQWLGRQIQRRAIGAEYSWTHLPRAWYASEFEPFAQTVPLSPFGIAGNPLRMTDDVAWCWTDTDLKPSLMGVNEYVQVSMNVTGYW